MSAHGAVTSSAFTRSAVNRPRLMPRARTTILAAVAVLFSCVSLHPVLRGAGWYPHVMLAVLVATLTGALGRRLPGPALLLPLLTPLGLLLLLSAEGGQGTTFLGFIPTTGTARAVGHTVRTGVDDLHNYASPAPATRGIVLLCVAGVYVVAALVDLLAVTARRPGLAGVPLLAILLVPASVHGAGAGGTSVALALIGWFLLLANDGRERDARWGSALAPARRGRPSGQHASTTPRPAASNLRSGVAATVTTVALVVVALVPGLAAPHAVHPVRSDVLTGGGSAGLSPAQLRNSAPFVSIRSRLHAPEAPLLLVHTSAPDYLRQTALDDFDGNVFRERTDTPSETVDLDGTLASGRRSAATITTSITTQALFDEAMLPVPTDPRVISPATSVEYDATLHKVTSTLPATTNISYTISTAPLVVPTTAQLRQVGKGTLPPGSPEARDLALTPGLPSYVSDLAKQVTAGTTTEIDAANALQKWFSSADLGGFTYDLTASVDGGYNGLVEFLKEKHGYCEQFATAFAIMARSLHIPTRIAVGFTPGQTTTKDTAVVSTGDSHSWPEVWFNGYGWLRFEPTPRSDLAAFTPAYSGTRVSTPKVTPSVAASVKASVVPREQIPTRAATPAAGSTGTGASGGSGDGTWIVLAVVLLTMVGALAGPASARWGRRRSRIRRAHGGAPAPPLVWAELLDTLADHGIRPPARDTPRRTAARVADAFGDGYRVDDRGESSRVDQGRAAISRLAGRQEQARYQPPRTSAGPTVLDRAGGQDRASDQDWADVAAVRKALRTNRTRGERLRTALLPRSVVDGRFGLGGLPGLRRRR